MPNFNAIQNLVGMIENSPAFSKNQNARQMLDCIKNNDSQSGMKIAENLCKTYGVTPQEAVNLARQFFHF